MSKTSAAIGLLVGLSMLATSTWAVDVGTETNNYAGTIKCTVYADDGSKTKTKSDLSVTITQFPVDSTGVSNLNVLLEAASIFGEEGLSNAVLFDDANKPDKKGAGGGVLCVNDGDANDLNAVFNFNVKNSGQKIKGTASFTAEGENGTCKWNVKLTTVSKEAVVSCPD